LSSSSTLISAVSDRGVKKPSSQSLFKRRGTPQDFSPSPPGISIGEVDRRTPIFSEDSSVNSGSTQFAQMKNSRHTPPSPTDRPSDDALVARVLEGDKDSYRQLVEKYQNKVHSLAFDILKSKEDAEDVVQETFVKAYLSLPSFKGQSSFYTWLYRIAYNMSIDVKRRVNRRGGTHVEFKEVGSVSTPGSDEISGGPTVVPEDAQTLEGPAEAFYRKEAGSRIKAVLDELSPEHRAVVVLKEVDGLNYEEISEATGVPKGTVMSRLHYARKALQKALRDFAPNRKVDPNNLGNEEYTTSAGPVAENKT
jgi:RNA polymerase sigma-70 factor (ECF subfamily)